MDTEKIIQDLNRRFAEPLPEFYKRRIIFWQDEDKEFEDKLDEITLNNATVISLNGSNSFEVKKLLSNDDLTSNFLVYRPFAIDNNEDDWLLDIELYSEEFRADLVSIWMNEIGMPSSYELRKCVKHYKKFFKAKDRRKALSNLNKTINSARDLHLAVISAITSSQKVSPSSIIKAVLCGGLDIDNNQIFADLKKYDAEEEFIKMVAQGMGYSNDTFNLQGLMLHILITATTRTISEDYLSGLDAYISFAHQANCYDFISEWLHSEQSDILYDYAKELEYEMKIPERLIKLSVDDLLETECFPCVNEIILEKLMSDVNAELIDVQLIRTVVEKRRTCVWYDKVDYFFDGLLQVANMYEFYKEHSASFHYAEPEKLWEAYTSEFYLMDTYYRQYHLSFIKSTTQYNPNLTDLFSQVTDVVERLYTNWFLKELGANWSNICESDMSEYGYIPNITQQERFYQNKIKNADTRKFVIISDALRYEVAASLSEQIKREMQGKVELSSMQAMFPSATKFGMAALLPHKELSAEIRGNTLSILADGSLTESNYRDKILKQGNKNSVATNYKALIGMKRPERCELVKGMEVVYIYHNTIDDAAHTSDTTVFPACENAIDEIKNLMRIIVNDFSGVNIIITSDHGFLYNYSPLKEEDKADKSEFGDDAVEISRRYIIANKGVNPTYLMPVKFLHGKTEFEAFAPKESIRIKMNGAGLNFVHGGISLQEMIVPVIEYKHLRNDSKEYKRNKNKYDTKPVELTLLSANKKISNMIFALNFYQTEAVSDNRESATYNIYFTDANGKQISEVQKIIADKTSENGQDRTFRMTFHLKSLKYSNTETYYLVIADENIKQIPQRIEFEIDIALAADDYDFF